MYDCDVGVAYEVGWRRFPEFHTDIGSFPRMTSERVESFDQSAEFNSLLEGGCDVAKRRASSDKENLMDKSLRLMYIPCMYIYSGVSQVGLRVSEENQTTIFIDKTHMAIMRCGYNHSTIWSTYSKLCAERAFGLMYSIDYEAREGS